MVWNRSSKVWKDHWIQGKDDALMLICIWYKGWNCGWHVVAVGSMCLGRPYRFWACRFRRDMAHGVKPAANTARSKVRLLSQSPGKQHHRSFLFLFGPRIGETTLSDTKCLPPDSSCHLCGSLIINSGPSNLCNHW